jgi:uncharacterized protein (TIGR02466 family)
MTGKFNLTYTLGGSPTATVPGPTATQPAPAPSLRPLDLFPTRIWQSDLDYLMPHLDRWVKRTLALRAANPKAAGRTNRKGWNSEDMAILEQPEFAELRQAVRAGCTAALSQMGHGNSPYKLQSWINLHDRGGFNFLHLHEGSLLSGSFYLAVPPGSGALVFRDPRPGVIHGYVKGPVPNGYADVHLAPRPGLLVLFPYWLEHYVEPHESDELRITIAFNANP